MQAVPMRPPPTNEEPERWHTTEANRAAWMEFVEANKTLNSEYMIKNEPFDELPWQYFPKLKIDHRPPLFIYGFPLGDGVSRIEDLGRATGILEPGEPFTTLNFSRTMMLTLTRLKEECGLLENEFLSIVRCHSKTCASYVMMLKTNYKPHIIAPERLGHAIHVLEKHLPGKTPQWYLDPGILEMWGQHFEISEEALLST